jgi:hypothetical protein
MAKKVSKIIEELRQYEEILEWFEKDAARVRILSHPFQHDRIEFMPSPIATLHFDIEDKRIINYMKSYFEAKVYELRKELKEALKDA